jgi:diguanylate cyclase (GGDEF)-like protein
VESRPRALVERERGSAAELTSVEAEVVERADRSVEGRTFSPVFLVMIVAPLALGVLFLLRDFGLVSAQPVWLYLVVIAAAGALSVLVEPWGHAPLGSPKLLVCLAVHVTALTVVIYLSGWGPALGMAYVFIALVEMQSWGTDLWRPLMILCFANIAVAQLLLWYGLVPSFLTRGQATSLGVLGAVVLALAIRMAGATGAKREQAESLLAHQALHDSLTGLPNKAYLYERTAEALELSAVSGAPCAIVLFDLDHFKDINDTMGHRYGDRLLTEIGPRVGGALRDCDTLARLGGDEFCLLLPDVGTAGDAVKVARRIMATLEEPFEVDGLNLGIEASFGISMGPADGSSPDLLLQRADVAMYVAKEAHNGVTVYSSQLDPNTADHLALLGDLRHAVSRNEFVLHYQPKASMPSMAVSGAEALIRWQHPAHGLLYPDRFIPEAERSGLIEPMTEWVLDEALRQCREWLDTGGQGIVPELTVAVNLSTRSLLDSSLPTSVLASLSRWKVPARMLELEITETIIMTDPVRARRVLTELAEMGLTISIDDFGTGYSSLAYLRDLPVSQLKIDRSFVQEMGHDLDDAVIVRSVVDLARNLGLQTVAEGVEDADTWEQLCALGCDSAQGYFLARPMPVDAFNMWLDEHVTRVHPAVDSGADRGRTGRAPHSQATTAAS